jgi:hypothetical protein
MSANLADTTLTLNTPAAIPTGDFPFAYIDWLVLINASPFACHVTLGGYSFLLPAWYYYPVQIHDEQGKLITGISAPFVVTPYLQTIPGVNFTSILHSLIYMQGETPPNTTATPLGGGPVDLTVASSIVNINSANGTPVIFAKPSGDNLAQGAVNLKNDGSLTLGDFNWAGFIQVNASGGVAQANLLPNELLIFGANGLQDIIINADGAVVIDISQAVGSTGIKFKVGSLTRISLFNANVTAVSTFFNHGLGVIPDAVFLQVQGAATTVRTVEYDPATMTSTQVSLIGNLAFTVIGLALKL